MVYMKNEETFDAASIIRLAGISGAWIGGIAIVAWMLIGYQSAFETFSLKRVRVIGNRVVSAEDILRIQSSLRFSCKKQAGGKAELFGDWFPGFHF